MQAEYVQNAPEREEYMKALRALKPVLHDLPPKIITIDGRPGVGKTTLGRFLAWRFNVSLVETDLFIVRNQGKLIYRKPDLHAVIQHRMNSNRPAIVEGIVALRILAELDYKSDFHIRVVCEDADGSDWLNSEWECYESNFKPDKSSSLELELPAN